MIRLQDVYDANGKVTRATLSALYQLLAERPHAANISHALMPSFQTHTEFVKRIPYRAWYVVTDLFGGAVGAVYATRHNELGVAILREHQRRGYAREAIAELMRRLKPLPAMAAVRRGRWIANVSPKNEASQRLFGGAFGGRIIQITYELEEESHGEESTEGRTAAAGGASERGPEDDAGAVSLAGPAQGAGSDAPDHREGP